MASLTSSALRGLREQLGAHLRFARLFRQLFQAARGLARLAEPDQRDGEAMAGSLPAAKADPGKRVVERRLRRIARLGDAVAIATLGPIGIVGRDRPDERQKRDGGDRE